MQFQMPVHPHPALDVVMTHTLLEGGQASARLDAVALLELIRKRE